MNEWVSGFLFLGRIDILITVTLVGILFLSRSCFLRAFFTYFFCLLWNDFLQTCLHSEWFPHKTLHMIGIFYGTLLLVHAKKQGFFFSLLFCLCEAIFVSLFSHIPAREIWSTFVILEVEFFLLSKISLSNFLHNRYEDTLTLFAAMLLISAHFFPENALPHRWKLFSLLIGILLGKKFEHQPWLQRIGYVWFILIYKAYLEHYPEYNWRVEVITFLVYGFLATCLPQILWRRKKSIATT